MMKIRAAVIAGVAIAGMTYAEDVSSPAESQTVHQLAPVYRSFPLARVMLTWRAEQGDVVAQVQLGDAYFQGAEEIEQDYDRAVQWYRAAAQTSPAGQWRVGIMYVYGLGVPKDYATAARWFRAAAEQGNDEGQYLLGTMYSSGFGVPRDHASAARWFRAAAEQGNTQGQVLLGTAYRYGAGVQQDYISAYAWLNIAAVENAEARQGREQIAKLMTAAQIAEAQRLSLKLWARIEADSPLSP